MKFGTTAVVVNMDVMGNEDGHIQTGNKTVEEKFSRRTVI